jgi:hypothetical protein
MYGYSEFRAVLGRHTHASSDTHLKPILAKKNSTRKRFNTISNVLLVVPGTSPTNKVKKLLRSQSPQDSGFHSLILLGDVGNLVF